MASNTVVPYLADNPFGDWFTFSVNMPAATILGTITGVGTLELTETVPLDFLCTHISITAMRENPDNAALATVLTQLNDLVFTERLKINFKDSAAQEPWIVTDLANASSFDPIPLSLICGPQATPLPGLGRPLFQGTQITVKLGAETQAALPLTSNICVVSVNFMGRRMDSMTQEEREIVAVDPRTNGSSWLYVDGFPLTRGDSPPATHGGKGPEATQNCNFTRRPWNFVWEGLSCSLTSDNINPAPVSSALAEFSYTNNTNRKQTNLIPTAPYSRIHAGMAFGNIAAPTNAMSHGSRTAAPPYAIAQWDEVFYAGDYGPRWIPLGLLVLIASQSSFAFTGRSIFTPFVNAGAETINLNMLMWGSRVLVNEPFIAYPFLRAKNRPIQQGGPGGPMINPNTGYPVSQPRI